MIGFERIMPKPEQVAMTVENESKTEYFGCSCLPKGRAAKRLGVVSYFGRGASLTVAAGLLMNA